MGFGVDVLWASSLFKQVPPIFLNGPEWEDTPGTWKPILPGSKLFNLLERVVFIFWKS